MNMSEYFNSDEKFKRRYTQSEKKVAQNVQSMDCAQLSVSEKKLKDREKSQPVRIVELFGYSEKTKSCPRESVRKRLPERLNHGEKDINSNQRRQEHTTEKKSPLTINARRKLNLTISPKQYIQSNSKVSASSYDGKNEDTGSAGNKINSYRMSVTRNNLRYSTYNINNGKKNVTDHTNGLLNEPCGSENKRKSFLLPPNSIRNKHLVTENGKEQLKVKNKKVKSKDIQQRHSRICTEYESTELNENLYSSKLMKDNTEASEVNDNAECNPIQEDKETFPDSSPVEENVDLDRPSVIVNPQVITKKHIPSKLHSIIEVEKLDNSDFSLQQENSLLSKKNLHRKSTSLESKSKKNNLPLSNTRENCQEQVHYVESKYLPHENVRKLCIDEKDVVYMKSNLESLICETEEKLFNLKEMLKHVNKILNSNNSNEQEKASQKDIDSIQNSHCTLEREDENIVPEEQKSLQENSNKKVEKVLTEKCIQPIINKENICIKETQMVKKDEYALMQCVLPKENNVDEYLDLTIENEEKENLNVIGKVNDEDVMEHQDLKRYSGTPKQIQSMYNKDDSFLNLEDQLNIIHVKALSNSSCLVITPVKRKPKWHEKSLQEYMMLKSSISFLQTPDTKRFQSKLNKNDENAVSNTLKTCISHKVLTELRDLCTDSPL